MNLTLMLIICLELFIGATIRFILLFMLLLIAPQVAAIMSQWVLPLVIIVRQLLLELLLLGL